MRIARSDGAVVLPCRISLVAAANPCPCGHRMDGPSACRCSPLQIYNYESRLSGPLVDRMDLQVLLSRLGRAELLDSSTQETSAVVRARVASARCIQLQRYGSSLVSNASATRSQFEGAISLSPRIKTLLSYAIEDRRTQLTGRGLARALRVARTIADLALEEIVLEEHVGEALQIRMSREASEVVA